ncbi:hypothetical protein MY4038_010027 [Beauveria bassiana]
MAYPESTVGLFLRNTDVLSTDILSTDVLSSD